VKECLYQSLSGNDRYSPPHYLRPLFVDLSSIGLRNLWYRIFPSTILSILHHDLLVASSMLQKLLKLLITGLHHIWIERYQFIHTLSSDENALDKLLVIHQEYSKNFYSILTSNHSVRPHSTLKGSLFEYYASSDDSTNYERLNSISSYFINQINHQCSSNDIAFRSFLRSQQISNYSNTI